MDPKIVDVPRKLVRPLVTVMLVGTMCGCVIVYALYGEEYARDAAAIIGVLAGFVVEKWFEARRRERENN